MTTGKLPDNNALLFYPEMIDPSDPAGLWWCKDAFDVQELKYNAVCMAMTAEWEELNPWVEWVEQFQTIVVAMPDSAERDEVLEELTARFGIPVIVPSANSWVGHSCMKDMIADFGPMKGPERLLLDAEEVPVKGLINIREVDLERRRNPKRIVSGLAPLDRAIGGFSGSTLTVWTGKRGEGKSTNVGQLAVLEAVEQGHCCCVYSGEMPKEAMKKTLMQQAAGKYHVLPKEDEWTGRTIYEPQDYAKRWIDKWWDKRLYLCDIQRKGAHDEDTIFKNFEYAIRRHGADVFVVDNIMTANLKGEKDAGQWRAQSAFVTRLTAFAKRYDVAVHLVAHPRKTTGPIENDDVGGSSDITNLADTVIKIERVPEERVEELGYSTMLSVIKNREFGDLVKIPLLYEEESRRLYPKDGNTFKAYSWEALKQASMEG